MVDLRGPVCGFVHVQDGLRADRNFFFGSISTMQAKGGVKARGQAMRLYLEHPWCMSNDGKVHILEKTDVKTAAKTKVAMEAFEVISNKQTSGKDRPGLKLIFTSTNADTQRLIFK